MLTCGGTICSDGLIVRGYSTNDRTAKKRKVFHQPCYERLVE